MLYTEFINRAINITIIEADNGTCYLEPLWRNILHDNKLFFNDVSDFEITPEIVADVLHLEVDKRNAVNSKKNIVLEWLYEIIISHVDTVMLEEETDYLKNLVEYLQAKKESKPEKDADWDKFTNTKL